MSLVNTKVGKRLFTAIWPAYFDFIYQVYLSKPNSNRQFNLRKIASVGHNGTRLCDTCCANPDHSTNGLRIWWFAHQHKPDPMMSEVLVITKQYHWTTDLRNGYILIPITIDIRIARPTTNELRFIQNTTDKLIRARAIFPTVPSTTNGGGSSGTLLCISQTFEQILARQAYGR